MEQKVKTDNFETFLLENGFLTKALYEKLDQQAKAQNESVLSLIKEQKILPPQTLAQAKAAFLNIPYTDLQDVKIDQKILDLIPEDTRLFYHFLSFVREGQNLKVAITDPTDLQALEALEFFSKKQGFNIQLYVTDEDNFNRVTSKTQNISKVVGEALAHIQATEKQEQVKAKQKAGLQAGEPELQSMIQDAPISKIVDVILSNAIDGSASDVHIEPTDKDLRVRYRVDGVLHVALILPLNVQNAVVSKIKILSNLKIDESRLPQDGRFHYETATKSVDLRVSILPNVNGEKVVMRILDKSTKVPTLEQLGFRGKALTWVLENIKKTHGIFLVTGPTGSGKSTTLYSLLSMLNTTKVNIITLEDPVEYFMQGVNQTQINPDIGLTFAAGLRSILRQDPNIIMVGEIRDKETAELAVHAALTGHLVFSTLHTNNAIGALPRLIDMNIEPFLLVASINAVAAQRLVRMICPDCKQEIKANPEAVKNLLDKLKDLPAEETKGLDLKNIKLYEGKGCPKCGDTGYKGRVAITEVLPVVPSIQDLVLAKVPPSRIYEEAKKLGMISMEQDGAIKVIQGITTYEEVIRVTSE